MTKTWITDANGNRASVERWGSEEAARQSLATLRNCSDCSYCSDLQKKTNQPDGGKPSAILEITIPKIKNIHQRVFEAVSQPNALNMDSVHTCETTHCRAGLVVTLAGEEGKALEARFNWELAAMLIYRESGYRINPSRFYAALGSKRTKQGIAPSASVARCRMKNHPSNRQTPLILGIEADLPLSKREGHVKSADRTTTIAAPHGEGAVDSVFRASTSLQQDVCEQPFGWFEDFVLRNPLARRDRSSVPKCGTSFIPRRNSLARPSHKATRKHRSGAIDTADHQREWLTPFRHRLIQNLQTLVDPARGKPLLLTVRGL